VPTRARWSLPGAAVVMSSGVVVAAAFLLSFSAVPLADDFCYAATRRTWPQYMVHMYQHWSGRWLAMALYAAIWPRVDITSAQYPALLAVLWASLLTSLFVLMRLVWGPGLTVARSAAGALVLAALFLSGMPSPGESMYWLAGGTQYTLTIALSIFGVAALERAAKSPRGSWQSLSWSVLGLVLVGAVTGLNEVAALTLLLVLLAIGTLAHVGGTPSAARWKAAVLVAALGCVVTVVAPGNAVRLAKDYAGGAVSALRVSNAATAQIGSYLLPWLTDIHLVLASVLVLASPWLGVPPWAQGGSRVRLVAVPAVAAVAVLIPFLLMTLKIGAVGPPRLYNYAYGVFLVGWLVSLAAWSDRLRLSPSGGAGVVRAIAAALLVLSLLSASNTLGYLADLTGSEARRFHRQMARIHRSLRDASRDGNREVRIPALPRSPVSFLSAPLGPNASHWHNRCVAIFFGVERVAVSTGGG